MKDVLSAYPKSCPGCIDTSSHDSLRRMRHRVYHCSPAQRLGRSQPAALEPLGYNNMIVLFSFGRKSAESLHASYGGRIYAVGPLVEH